jgi:hypothetical protein
MFTLLGSQSPPADPLTFNQLGIAAVVCVLLLSALWITYKQLLASQARERQLSADAVGREREIADRVVPALLQAAELLTVVPAKLEQTLRTAEDSAGRRDLDSVLGRLERAIGEMSSDRSS